MKKIRYPTENEKEGITKLENLIKNYPFHFLKVYNEFKQDQEFPMLQIIISCKMKGFSIPSSNNYMRNIMRYRGLNTDDINRFENLVINHLNSLIEEIGYTETKEYLEMNNSFKELNVWIEEMYKRLSYFDNDGGWNKVGVDDYQRIEEILKREKIYRGTENDVKVKFKQIFGFQDLVIREETYKNLTTSEEFDEIISNILMLLGKGSYKCNGGKVRLIGSSVEDIEESCIYSSLQKYPRVLKNMDQALEHKIKKKWNEVALYCCKAIEYFYKIILGNKKKYEKLTLRSLTEAIRRNQNKLLKIDDTVWLGVDKLLQSCVNLVGTIRNSRDSGHGNDRDVEKWESQMVYNYTIVLLRTLIQIIK
ncbi:MAG: hypothetical protein JXA99_16680 [Candidatus Lokiarchaeota archaeon]|nr:hypothetical protein [Candidatus Lokiarchaeota archaeon]